MRRSVIILVLALFIFQFVGIQSSEGYLCEAAEDTSDRRIQTIQGYYWDIDEGDVFNYTLTLKAANKQDLVEEVYVVVQDLPAIPIIGFTNDWPPSLRILDSAEGVVYWRGNDSIIQYDVKWGAWPVGNWQLLTDLYCEWGSGETIVNDFYEWGVIGTPTLTGLRRQFILSKEDGVLDYGVNTGPIYDFEMVRESYNPFASLIVVGSSASIVVIIIAFVILLRKRQNLST